MVQALVDKLGGVSSMARRLGVARQTIYYWIKADRIPEGAALKLSHVYGLPLEDVGLAMYAPKR